MDAEDMIQRFEWDAIVNLMDDEIREAVHADLSQYFHYTFLAEYCWRHFLRFGTEFTVN